MKSIATLTDGFKSTVSNHRGHEFITDLPEKQNGSNAGPTPLELSVMSLSSCISTLFAIIAKNSKLSFASIEVEVNADKPSGAKTIEAIDVKANIKSTESIEKIQRIFDKSVSICPVGVLYEKAGIDIKTMLEINNNASI